MRRTTLNARRSRVPLLPILAISFLSFVPRMATADDLKISAAFADKPFISSIERIELSLSRALLPAEGRLAVVVGNTDVSAMLVVDGSRVSYVPRLPLPAGESEVSIWLVAGTAWKEIARFALRVGSSPANHTPPGTSAFPSVASTSASASSPTGNALARPQRRWGFDTIEPTTNLGLNLKAQPGSSTYPAPSPGISREKYFDLAGQAALGVTLTRGSVTWSNRFEIAGSSYKNEALRYGEMGPTAPNVDLSSYLVQIQHGASSFALGHVSYGTHRHLINSFSSRGVTARIPIGKRADFTAAAVNGTNIVGWDNFFGLSRSNHHVFSGVLGYEFVRSRPQGLRVEAGVLSGSLLPLTDYSQQTLTDVERSFGATLRVIASDPANRLKVDIGYTGSRFSNKRDPLLDQGNHVTDVPETLRSAEFADISLVLLREARVGTERKANLTVNFRHERVDPFFRSVAATTQADRFQNQIELTGNIGDANFTVLHTRFNDNLDNLPSILKSLTRREGLNLNLPISMLAAPFFALSKHEVRQDGEQSTSQRSAGTDTHWSVWFPRVGFTFDRVHQYGASIPVNGAWRPDLTPDQLSLNYNLSADWQFSQWRLSYRFNRSSQDNRQPGRALSDFTNLVNGISVGINPTRTIDVNFEVNSEEATNHEYHRVDRTLRYGVNSNWRITSRATLALNLTMIGAGDLARTSSSRTIEGDLQFSYRLDGEHPISQRLLPNRLSAQLFVRYTNRFARTSDFAFSVHNLTKVRALNAGVSVTF